MSHKQLLQILAVASAVCILSVAVAQGPSVRYSSGSRSSSGSGSGSSGGPTVTGPPTTGYPTGTPRVRGATGGAMPYGAPSSGPPSTTPPTTTFSPGATGSRSTGRSTRHGGLTIYQSPRTTRNRTGTTYISPSPGLTGPPVRSLPTPPTSLPNGYSPSNRYSNRTWYYPNSRSGSRRDRDHDRWVGNNRLWYDFGTVPTGQRYYAPGYGYSNHTTYFDGRSHRNRVSYRQVHASPYRQRSYYACPWYDTYYYPNYSWDGYVTWYAPGFPLRVSYQTSAGYYNTYFSYGYGTGVVFGDSDCLYSWYPYGGFVRMVLNDNVPESYTRYIAPRAGDD